MFFSSSCMLSKLCEGQFGLISHIQSVRRRGEGFMDPSPEVSVDKEVQAQERHQIREAPSQTAAHLEILQEQDGDECCPNLDVHRIGAGSHEGFDFQVLLNVL